MGFEELKKEIENLLRTTELSWEAFEIDLEGKVRQLSSDTEKEIEEIQKKIKEEFGELTANLIGGLLRGLYLLIYYGSYAIGYSLGMLDLGRVQGQRDALKLTTPYIPSPSDAIDLYIKGLIDDFTLRDILKMHGIADNWIDKLISATYKLPTPELIRSLWRKKLLSTDQAFKMLKLNGLDHLTASLFLADAFNYLNPSDLIQAWLRGLISEDKLYTDLKRYGYLDDDIEVIKQLAYIIPPVSDIIRFAVREAFNPVAIEKFQLLSEFPEEFAKWAEKQGLSKYWAERYWIAHWDLPSLTEGFEMFHRTIDNPIDDNADVIKSPFGGVKYNVIGKRTLELLIKSQDISPFWRDKLIQIAYAPLTRVDLRRAYDLGVIDENGVYFGYRDLGYNDQNARILTEFTILEVISEERTKVRNEAIQLYIDGVFTEEELRSVLQSLRYNEKTIEILIEYAKFRKARKRIEGLIKSFKRMYMRGELDDDEARDILVRNGIELEDAIRIVEDWKYEKEANEKVLTKEEIKEALRKKIITPEEGRKYLRKLGYNDDVIDILFALWGVK